MSHTRWMVFIYGAGFILGWYAAMALQVWQ